MEPKIVYFDMDSVLCDFMSVYKTYFKETVPDRTQFVNAVNNNIFIKLPRLKNGIELFNYTKEVVSETDWINRVEILTSVGSNKFDIGYKTATQKIEWLRSNEIYEHISNVNFVTSRNKKGEYANPNCLLIDDHIDCINSFKENKGNTIHIDFTKEVTEVQMKECKNLVFDFLHGAKVNYSFVE